MITFLLARLHRTRLHELVAARELPTEFAPDVVRIACPKCGDEFFADLEPEEEPILLDQAEWAAVVRLDEECPDHAHRFEVDQ